MADKLPQATGALQVPGDELIPEDLLPLITGGSVETVTSLAELQAFIFEGGLSQRAVLQTPLRIYVSDRIVSTNARVLRDIYQTPGDTTITVETVEKHGWSDSDTISVRADGLDGTTKMANPANGDDWGITVVDEYSAILKASVWVANSQFWTGLAYTGSITLDARPELQRLMDIAAEDGGLATCRMPNGVAALLSKSGPTHSLGMRSAVSFEGMGATSSWIYAGDGLNGHMLFWYEEVSVEVRRLTTYGNRQYQGVGGFHSLRFAGDYQTITSDVLIEDVNIFASAGYGGGCQGEGSFVTFRFRNVTINGSDSDGWDFKNRTNENDSNTADGLNLFNTGLFVQGIDFQGRRLANNPITTSTITPSIITVAHPGTNFAVGIPVTLEGATSFNGLNFSSPVSGIITSRNSSGYTLDISPQVATASGAGGGSTVDAYGAMFSVNDAFFDTRGQRWLVSNLHIKGDMQGRTGLRGRRGVVGTSNGSGSHKSVFKGITVTHTGPVAQQGNGVSVQMDDAVVDGVTCYNVRAAVAIASSVRRGTVKGVTSYSSGICVQNDGENVAVSDCTGYDSKVASFYVDGGLAEDSGDLPADAFTTTDGSNLVVVSMPLHAHVTGNSVTYDNMVPFNNIDANGTFVVTVLTPDTVRITVSTNAVGSDSGGGENATYEWAGSSHLARLNTYVNCKSVASVLGYQTTAKSRDTQFLGCSSYQDTTPYSDQGLRTKWRNNTGDLPSLDEIVDLPLDGTPLTLATADATPNKLYYLPTTATAKAVINIPAGTANNRGMRVRVANGSGTYGIEVRLQGTGNIRVGSTMSTVGLACAAAGDSIDIEFREVSQQRWMAIYNIGTWTAL